MPNEFIIKNGFRSQGNSEVTGSLSISGSISTISPINLTGFATGSVLFTSGSAGVVTGSSNLVWDNTNGRLGIGGTPGAFTLDVTGTARTLGVSHFRGPANSVLGSNLTTTSAALFYSNTFSGVLGIGSYSNSGAEIQSAQNGGLSIGGFLTLQRQGGNVLIGTATDAGYKLDVNGSARSTAFRLTNNSLIADTYTPGATILQISNNSVGTHNGAIGISVVCSVGITAYSNLGINGSNPVGASIYAAGGSAFGNISLGILSNRALITSTANGLAMHTSSMLQVDSTTQGFLPPRTNLTSNISTPAQGLMTYITASTTEGLYYYNSGSTPGWRQVADTTFVSASLSGSAGYLPVFTGTNSVSSSVIFQSGSNVGIGTSTPISFFDVVSTSGFPKTFISFRRPTVGDWGLSLGSETISNLYIGAVDVPGTVTSRYFWRANYNTAGVAANTFRPIDAALTTVPVVEIQGVSSTSANYFSITSAGASMGDILGVKSTGNVLINSTTDAGYKLDVNGTARVSGLLTLSNGSYTTAAIGWGAQIGLYYDASLGIVTNIGGVVASSVNGTRFNFDKVVGIGTFNMTNDASARLQINSTTQGFLPPRTNLTSNISTPAQGLITYLTGSTNEGLYYYNSGSLPGWHKVLTASGSQSITGSLDVTAGITGSLLGTSSYATTTLSASYAATASLLLGSVTSASFASTASFINPLNQSVVLTGSLSGQVSALSIVSTTASLDLSTNNFFTLTLANGSDTHINPTNIQPGQTVNLRVTQGSAGTGTVSFPSFVDQASGSAYTASTVANAIDIVTMIAFDSTSVYLSSIRNMI